MDLRQLVKNGAGGRLSRPELSMLRAPRLTETSSLCLYVYDLSSTMFACSSLLLLYCTVLSFRQHSACCSQLFILSCFCFFCVSFLSLPVILWFPCMMHVPNTVDGPVCKCLKMKLLLFLTCFTIHGSAGFSHSAPSNLLLAHKA